jgi:hypothetical protein
LQLGRDVDARERWQALQGHLSAARHALSDGNRSRALQEVDAALAIDPNFTAAVALRERISIGPDTPPLARTVPPVAVAAEAQIRRPIDFPQPARAAAPRPLVSAEGYARFEERARRRRIERRAEAARAAIAAGHRREARSAMDEIRALDPNASEIAALSAALSASRRAATGEHSGWHLGPQLVAACVFAMVVLAAPWVEKPPGLLSYPISIVTALVSTAQPAPLTASAVEPPSEIPAGTVGDSIADVSTPVADMRPRSSTVKLTEFAPPVSTIPLPAVAVRPTPAPPPPSLPAPANVAASLPPPSAVPGPPPVAASPLPAATEPAVVEARLEDDGLVRKALLQYKSAYEALDARSARAVWPVVNERALARAFDGLESQHLIFDACDIQVNGAAAAATCRGTARYVAKIGSREPRTEPRVWNFTLKKSGQDWKIESARAER